MNLLSKSPALALLLLGVAPFNTDMPAEAADDSDIEAVVDGNTKFALDLYSRLKDEDGNLFFSPYSISVALAMTYAGARENTAQQMSETLRFSLDPQRLHPAFEKLEARLEALQEEGNVQLEIANSLWPHKIYPILEEYINLVKKYYGVQITPLDYAADTEAARRIINEWVEEKTKDKIRDMIAPGVLNALTRLVLVNAIYFKGNWADQFEEDLTKDAPFHLLSGESTEVPMMKQQETFGYAEHEDLQILQMPYAGDEVSMLVLLPKKEDGLADLQSVLDEESLEEWIRSIRKTEVLVFLPKFKVTSQFRLDEALASMGMPDAFDPKKADLSGIDGEPHRLYIGAVIHKAFVDVNEEGTEAAASTAVGFTLASVPEPVPTFRADHPFIFVIRDNNTGSILFMGRIVDPAK
jgi:serpin B